ncbi:hypothetical protein ACFQRK_13945 [Parapedobacter sp. GCM10030251]
MKNAYLFSNTRSLRITHAFTSQFSDGYDDSKIGQHIVVDFNGEGTYIYRITKEK